MIPREIIDEIVYRNEIDQVIGSYVTLKRAGSNYNGLCPFHNEKTPSFTVFPATKSFYCFGCGAGGDVISFIMREENLDYVGAVEHLAARAGISIPVEDAPPIEVAAPAKPAVTLEQIQKKATQIAAGSAEKKAKLRGIVNQYAPKVTDLPEGCWAAVWDALCALESEA